MIHEYLRDVTPQSSNLNYVNCTVLLKQKQIKADGVEVPVYASDDVTSLQSPPLAVNCTPAPSQLRDASRATGLVQPFTPLATLHPPSCGMPPVPRD